MCSFPVMSRRVSIAAETTYWSPKTQRNPAGADLGASSLWARFYNIRKYDQSYWRRKEIINLPVCKSCERQQKPVWLDRPIGVTVAQWSKEQLTTLWLDLTSTLYDETHNCSIRRLRTYDQADHGPQQRTQYYCFLVNKYSIKSAPNDL